MNLFQEGILTQDRELEEFIQGVEVRRTDRDLQIIRRLDWRFLLPDPGLRDVGYIGREDRALLEALQRFSHSLTVVDRNTLQDRVFDVLVGRSASLEEMRRGANSLRSGGYLYYEIDRPALLRILSPGRTGRVGSLNIRNFQEALEPLGFGNFGIFWHRPSFENCLDIIPLDDPDALNFVLSKVHSRLLTRIRLFIGRLLLDVGLLPRLVPCCSIVACKEER